MLSKCGKNLKSGKLSDFSRLNLGEIWAERVRESPRKVETMYLLGYIPQDNRLYLGDKELNVVR